MRGCNIIRRRCRRGGAALIALTLTSLLGTDAFAQERLAISSCSEMSIAPVVRDDPGHAVRRAIARRDWREVRNRFAAEYPMPLGLASGDRILALRAFRSVKLIYASAVGDLGQVNALLTGGADPNVEVQLDAYATPLAWAARCNHPSVVRRLIRAGARVNSRFSYFDTQALHEGGTALIWASEAGSDDVVRLLLSRGAHAELRETFLRAGRPPRVSGVAALDVAANAAIAQLLRSRLRRH
jgi:Ankyrin repeats (3 copies)